MQRTNVTVQDGRVHTFARERGILLLLKGSLRKDRLQLDLY